MVRSSSHSGTLDPLPIGLKNDTGKDDWSLLPVGAVRHVVKVLMYGAALYGAENWRHVKNAQQRYYSAAFRHLTAWWEGNDNDNESGLPHLAHACCCVLFLLALDLAEPDPPA